MKSARPTFCTLRLLAVAAFALASLPLPAQTPAPATSQPPTYFEFGTVVAVGRNSIDIQTFDDRRQRLVQHSFQLSREARADVVRVGDQVEVIFTPGVDWVIRRLILLTAGIPRAGPPTEGAREVPAPTTARLAPPAAAPKVPAATSATLGNSARPAPTSSARNVTVAPPPASGKAVPATSPVALGAAPAGKAAPAVDVPLGAGAAALPRTPVAKAVTHERPAEECNRDSAAWPSEPLRMAVLDFRYPTEREEAHDVGTTGGGSGTAVADLVFARLDQLKGFAMSRGDRTRLYRADFAGAARVGRELGVDAVLAGTFAPQDPPPGSDPDFPPPVKYELRAGIVDTCTGQLLMRLTSVECPPGLDPNAAANLPACQRLAVTARQAQDPKETARAFDPLIASLLYPLEHPGPPPGTEGSAGTVREVNGSTVFLRLPAGTGLKSGDQVALHAWRLTKNPTTYTLHNLHGEEIGRVTLTTIQGTSATGTFTGDFPPHPGDTAELIPQ